MNVTKAVILAAGEGSRMHPLTFTRPKVMLPLANQPILERLLIEMKKAGLRDFYFITGYCADTIKHYFGAGERWGVKIHYIDQPQRLGTADALRMVAGPTEPGDLPHEQHPVVGAIEISPKGGLHDEARRLARRRAVGGELLGQRRIDVGLEPDSLVSHDAPFRLSGSRRSTRRQDGRPAGSARG